MNYRDRLPVTLADGLAMVWTRTQRTTAFDPVRSKQMIRSAATFVFDAQSRFTLG